MEEVGNKLKELEEKTDIILEELQQNENFIDVSIEATQIALKTSLNEKKEALRNATLNAALTCSIDKSLQKMFLSFIDILTVWHIKLLQLFDDPPGYMEKNKVSMGNVSMGAMSQLVEKVFPELKGKREIYDLIWKDLYSRALVNTDGLHTMMTGSGIVAKRTTEIGSLFMDYITDPVGEKT